MPVSSWCRTNHSEVWTMSTVHQTGILAADDQSIGGAAEFLAYIQATGCSPNTVKAYSHDLVHLGRFLREEIT